MSINIWDELNWNGDQLVVGGLGDLEQAEQSVQDEVEEVVRDDCDQLSFWDELNWQGNYLVVGGLGVPCGSLHALAEKGGQKEKAETVVQAWATWSRPS
eukprot:9862818-Alexandrium_andersonii.AAC.1